MKPYPEYKDAGVSWLAHVPTHWQITKIKRVTAFINGYPFKPNDWKEHGLPIIRIQNLNGSDEFNYTDRLDIPDDYHVLPGDLLFAWSGNIGTSFGPFLWNKQVKGYLNQHIFKLKDYSLERQYFYWVLKAVTRYIESKAGGIIGLVHVTKPELGDTEIPCAPPDEQTAIVAFLDRKNTEIDEFITRKRQLIALLNEQKAAIIAQAVTKGLDLNAPRLILDKASGASWLGEIPAHWSTQRNAVRFAERIEYGNASLPLLAVSIQSGVTIGEEDENDPKRTIEDRSLYKVTRQGDIAYNMMRMWQGAVGVTPVDGLVSPAYVVAKPLAGTNSSYYSLLYRTDVFKNEVNRQSRGIVSDRNRLYWQDFKQMSVPVPPLSEQEEIVRFLKQESTSIDEAISRIEREIELIQEYRTALISEAVTGKIDVREETP